MKGHPVVLAPRSSAGGWHKVEIWYDGVDGRLKVSVDGYPLVDRVDVQAADGSSVDVYRMMMVASTVSPLAEVLFDDLEFWNFPPGGCIRPLAACPDVHQSPIRCKEELLSDRHAFEQGALLYSPPSHVGDADKDR